MRRIYLDHAATTPLSPAAREAMLPWLDAGNASSLYAEGRRAKDALDAARETLSNALGCLFAEVLFTSGGTEAANLAIIGTALSNEDSRRNRILLGAAEHHCVLHTESILRRLDYQVDLIAVDREARIDLNDLEAKLGSDVLVVSAMHANNELGSINRIGPISDLAHREGALLHVDAVQTFLRRDLGLLCPEGATAHSEGRSPGNERPIQENPLPPRPETGQTAAGVAGGEGRVRGASARAHWTVDDLRADLVTVSSHKVNGPKGAGAIYTRAGVKLKPLVGGGGQEREVRGGTENVAAIVGFGAAVADHLANPRRVQPFLRDQLLGQLEALGAERTVGHEPVLASHAHVRFPGRDAETLLIALDRAGVSASSGAACSSGSVEPSHVLLACGYSAKQSREGLRFTLGPETTNADIEEATDRMKTVLSRSVAS